MILIQFLFLKLNMQLDPTVLDIILSEVLIAMSSIEQDLVTLTLSHIQHRHVESKSPCHYISAENKPFGMYKLVFRRFAAYIYFSLSGPFC